MTTKMVVCPECGAAVPHGRLSCVACGTLLASVASSGRRTTKRATSSASRASTRRAEPMTATETAVSTADHDDARAAGASMSLRPRSQSAMAAPATIDEPMTGAEPMTGVEPVTDQTPAPDPYPSNPEPAEPAAASAPSAPAWPTTAGLSPAPQVTQQPEPSLDAPSTPDLDDWSGPRPSVAQPVEGEEWSVVGSRPAAPRSAVPPTAASVAGAYLAPSAVISTDPRARTLTNSPRPAVPAATATPAPLPNRWYTSSDDGAGAATATFATSPFSSSSFAAAATGGPGETQAPKPTGFLSHFHSPEGAGGWATAVGATVAAVAFLLPWARYGVAGTQGDRGYLGQWGLANPAYLLLLAGSVAVLLLTIVPNRLPKEARAVALPLLLGGLLLGLGWSYLTGPFGTGPGVDAMAFGAVLLVVGGILELRPDRRTATSQP